jgi:hypothetical protein
MPSRQQILAPTFRKNDCWTCEDQLKVRVVPQLVGTPVGDDVQDTAVVSNAVGKEPVDTLTARQESTSLSLNTVCDAPSLPTSL